MIKFLSYIVGYGLIGSGAGMLLAYFAGYLIGSGPIAVFVGLVIGATGATIGCCVGIVKGAA